MIVALHLNQVEVAAAHRGRLSLLVNLLGKPLGALCTEMEGKQSDFRVGDVKYHLGQSGVVRVGPARTHVAVSIAPNPSHLEVRSALAGAISPCNMPFSTQVPNLPQPTC
jgi:2-oxoglutarate dehydrogenase complex dehydrogenase (E1) component-like enzyme